MSDEQRVVRSDPEDVGALYKLMAKRARVEGSDVWLECLDDIGAWNIHPERLQDQATDPGPWKRQPRPQACGRHPRRKT